MDEEYGKMVSIPVDYNSKDRRYIQVGMVICVEEQTVLNQDKQPVGKVTIIYCGFFKFMTKIKLDDVFKIIESGETPEDWGQIPDKI